LSGNELLLQQLSKDISGAKQNQNKTNFVKNVIVLIKIDLCSLHRFIFSLGMTLFE